MVKRYGMIIDLEKCIGCHTCTIACKMENRLRKGSRILVETIGDGGTDRAAGNFPDLRMHYRPNLCRQCIQPDCLAACPADAIYIDEDGIVLVNYKKCNGCQACIAACTHGAIGFDAETGRIEKCDMCSHRLAQGLAPFCVLCCETRAISFGDLADPQSEVSKLVKHAESPDPGKVADDSAVYFISPKLPRRL